MVDKVDPEKVGEKARELFLSGFNCAESVLTANMEAIGVKAEWIPRIASGFGGGIARTGQVCGAITGSIICLGWVYGRNGTEDDIEILHELGRKLVDVFIEEYGTTSCGMLIDVDLTNEDACKKAQQDGIFEERCASFVRFCASNTAGMIK